MAFSIDRIITLKARLVLGQFDFLPRGSAHFSLFIHSLSEYLIAQLLDATNKMVDEK
ncbi:hypothetical protein H4F05_10420 [Vibrio cholerae]